MHRDREYRFGPFLVRTRSWQLQRSGQPVHLEPIALKLLVFLIEHRDRLVTKQELMDTVWGDTVVTESALSKAVARLRRALGEDATHPKYIETAHALGYRFIAAVEEIDPAGDCEHAGGARSGIRTAALVLPVLLLIAGLLIMDPLGWRAREEPKAASPPIRSLAVLPLNNLAGDRSQDYFAEGLQDILITDLSKIGGLRVISRQSTLRYRNSSMTAPEIARELKVDALIEGAALLHGDRVKVTAQLIHGRSDRHLWAQTYDREIRDVLSLLNEMARTISREIEVVLSPQEAERLASAGPVDARANEAYLKGLYYLNQFPGREFLQALDYFAKAVEIAPEFALGWSGLAGAHLLMAYHGDTDPRVSVLQARAAALRSLELDEHHYAGHAALGWVRLMTWDWPGAGQAFEEALSRNPNDPMTLHGYADYLMLTGNPEAGLGRLRQAVAIDPHSPSSVVPLPFHLYMMGRYDEAIQEIGRFLEQDADHPVKSLLPLVYWQQGRLEDALGEFRAILASRGHIERLEALERGYTSAGPVAAMRSLAQSMSEQAGKRNIDPMDVAAAFARAGEVDEAFNWLEIAMDKGSLDLMYVVVRPEYDMLRGDPRYANLLQRLGLPG